MTARRSILCAYVVHGRRLKPEMDSVFSHGLVQFSPTPIIKLLFCLFARLKIGFLAKTIGYVAIKRMALQSQCEMQSVLHKMTNNSYKPGGSRWGANTNSFHC